MLLHGETALHQVHGGAATSHHGDFDERLAEYAAVTGERYRVPEYPFPADPGECYRRLQAADRFLVGGEADG